MIKYHIEEIQNEIREKYGVEAKVEVSIHSHHNIGYGKSLEIACELQPDFEARVRPWNNVAAGITIDNYRKNKCLQVYFKGDQ